MKLVANSRKPIKPIVIPRNPREAGIFLSNLVSKEVFVQMSPNDLRRYVAGFYDCKMKSIVLSCASRDGKYYDKVEAGHHSQYPHLVEVSRDLDTKRRKRMPNPIFLYMPPDQSP